MRHGTRGCYNRHKCRCESCRKVAKDYRNNQRLRTGKVKAHRKPPFLLKLRCLQCGTEVIRNQVQGKIFCSIICAAKYRENINICAILEAGSAAGFGLRSTRKAIRKRDGPQCAVCRLSKWMEKDIPLVLDHIDGNPENWNIDNLRLICCNCDAQTPTFKGKNRGNGRHIRRERYAAGKSY